MFFVCVAPVFVQTFPMRSDEQMTSTSKDGSGSSSSSSSSSGSASSSAGGSPGASNVTAGPLAGLRQFRKWLEGYDFAEVVAAKTGRGKGKGVKKGKGKKRAVAIDSDDEDSDIDVIDVDGIDDDSEEEGGNSKKTKAKASSSSTDEMDEDNDSDGDDEAKHLAKKESERKLVKFGKKHKGARARWSVKPDFPDERVAEAFLAPQANRDTTAFQWPVPRLDRVRTFCRNMLGWTDAEMDANVDPVISKYTSRGSQTRIDSFFLTYHDDNRFAKIASARMRNTVEQLTGKKSKLTVAPSPNPKKPRVSKKKDDNNTNPDTKSPSKKSTGKGSSKKKSPIASSEMSPNNSDQN